MKHYDILVKGKVQGVWYRQSTVHKANELNIRGYVMNLPNGTVYIEAEGIENNLKQLVDWCKKGPDGAKVEEVLHDEESNLTNFSIFEVRR